MFIGVHSARPSLIRAAGIGQAQVRQKPQSASENLPRANINIEREINSGSFAQNKPKF
jgi:hypothetical protein